VRIWHVKVEIWQVTVRIWHVTVEIWHVTVESLHVTVESLHVTVESLHVCEIVRRNFARRIAPEKLVSLVPQNGIVNLTLGWYGP